MKLFYYLNTAYITLILFAFNFHLKSQTESIVLLGDSILYNGMICNKIVNGNREGLFIDYKPITTMGGDLLYSIVQDLLADGSSRTEYFYFDLAPIYDTVEGKIVQNSTCNSSNHHGRYVCNYLEKFQYHIISYGYYKKGLKDGLWSYYTYDEKLGGQVFYKNGIISDTVFLYNEDKSIKAKIIPLYQDLFKYCEFNKTNGFSMCDTISKKDYKILTY
jgi:hypothetical protein